LLLFDFVNVCKTSSILLIKWNKMDLIDYPLKDYYYYYYYSLQSFVLILIVLITAPFFLSYSSRMLTWLRKGLVKDWANFFNKKKKKLFSKNKFKFQVICLECYLNNIKIIINKLTKKNFNGLQVCFFNYI